VELGVHLPLMQFGEQPLWGRRLRATVDAARECGFAAVSANDHFVFQTPWLDGLTALASVLERSSEMELATTVSLAVLRGPVALAKALMAIDVLSEGRLIAAVGPGSSERDYRAVGIPFDERWTRFDETLVVLRALLGREPLPGPPRHDLVPPDLRLAPAPHRPDGIPLWIGSWGSRAGLGRVAAAGDGWLASAYNTTPERFADARSALGHALEQRGREPGAFPNALATMWTWVTDTRADRDRMLADVLGPVLRREPEELRDHVCVGSVEHCVEILSRYAEAGCDRVYLWPLGDEARQVELVAGAFR
jgi:alkanesulfonate monooxygenase SsuD/methylene tetrahydromethanopterin reductase-like flavin-dependent oxidoreductase (luciferase family)